MSKVKGREWLDMTRLDFRHTFRSPLVEILIALFLYVSVSSVQNIQNISTNTGFGGTDNFLLYINSVTNLAFSKAVEALWMTLVFIVPPLVAFTTAKAFEDGSLRTILSYPIKLNNFSCFSDDSCTMELRSILNISWHLLVNASDVV